MTVRKLLNYWISSDRNGFYSALAIFFVLFYLLGTLMESHGAPELGRRFQLAGFIGFILLVIVHFVHRNLNAYYHFLDMFKDTDHLPQKQIAYVNSFCMTVFLIAAAAGIVVMAYAMEPLWHAIAEWFASLPAVEAEQPPQEPIIPQAMPAEPNMQELLGNYSEAGPTPVWVTVLNAVLEIGGLILVIVLLFYAIRKGAGKMWEFLTRPRHFDEDEKIYLKPTLDLLTNINPPESEEERPKKGLRYLMSYEARIRRYYKKQILTGRKQQNRTQPPAQWASPAELEQSAMLEDETLHRLYEKARYSPEECTEEDWNLLGR